MRDPSDRPIVDGLRRGDRAAFGAAFDKYRARVHGFLRRLAGRADVADDLFQDVWLKLAGAAPRLHEDTDLQAWLFTVARNAHVSYRRWNLLDLSRLVALGDESLVASSEPSADVQLDAARAIERLERALRALPARDREVLLLIGVEGLAQEYVAGILGIRYDALRQRLARSRDKLAALLAAIDADTVTDTRSREVRT